MNRQTGGNFAVDGLEEGEPLLVPMAFGDPADQLAVEEFKAANNVSVPCRM
jgi:hypothetical protein